ncbi:MAG: class I SAM-dependent methyltransferase [Mariniphaga sp.]|nr:class I SAM-dependent methyltransferase [Mariniphaga sp.]MDD4225434.1 class I SAM-dependent methyltransferase [Mariniphaga sp.]
MKTTQNEFYSSISRYYPEIFPYSPAQLQFVVRNCGGLTGKKVLDIGCATGELACEMAGAGAQVTGIDLNEDLIRQAKQKVKALQKENARSQIDPNPTNMPPLFKKGDMLELKNLFPETHFNCVTCFGNTLVHLLSPISVLEVLQGVHRILKPDGVFLLQILNYDYILAEQVSELPPIETENIKFVRQYVFEKDNPLIRFQTDLHIKKEGSVIPNETQLWALHSRKLTELLHDTGFKDILLFSNFKEDSFGGNHIPLVVKCGK